MTMQVVARGEDGYFEEEQDGEAGAESRLCVDVADDVARLSLQVESLEREYEAFASAAEWRGQHLTEAVTELAQIREGLRRRQRRNSNTYICQESVFGVLRDISPRIWGMLSSRCIGLLTRFRDYTTTWLKSQEKSN